MSKYGVKYLFAITVTRKTLIECHFVPVQNDVLSLTLAESKAHCNHLTILLGKYESNITAHQLSMSYADQALNVYQVLVGLLDTDLALLTSKCQVLGVCGYGMSYTICVDIVDILQIKLLNR